MRRNRWLQHVLTLCVIVPTTVIAIDFVKQNASVHTSAGVLVAAYHQTTTPSAPYYATSSFALTPTGMPIAQVHGLDGDVWTVGEFSNTLHHVTAAGQVEAIAVPLSYANQRSKPFFRKGARTDMPHSERVIRDSKGRLWFPQNGDWANWGNQTQDAAYSRLVSYELATQTFCVYPVPDSGANVMGVAWDEASDQIWFLQSGNDVLVSFNPDEFTDCEMANGLSFNDYIWELDSTSGAVLQPMPTRYCADAADTRCFHRFVLPNSAGGCLTANQLIVQQPGSPDAGAVWMTLFFANKLARFDPVTGDLQQFPLHRGRTITDDMFTWFLRVHEILVHPDDGDLLFSANGSGQLIRFDLQAYLAHDDDGLCERLSNNGRNPCMIAFEIPDVPFLTTHSVALDQFGNFWFTTWPGPKACERQMRPPSVGFINRQWTDMVYFDHLGVEPNAAMYPPGVAPVLGCSQVGHKLCPWWSYHGITVDDNNDVWIANFYSNMVSKLSFKHPAWVNPYCAIRGCEP